MPRSRLCYRCQKPVERGWVHSECAKEARIERERAKAPRKWGQLVEEAVCLCGAIFVKKSAVSVSCGNHSTQEWERLRYQHVPERRASQIAKAANRVRRLSAEAEQWHWSMLWDEGIRDCSKCGLLLDPNDFSSANGTPGPAYPSLEHIIPLSHGGTHTRDNLDLSHRGCNHL